MAPSTLKRVASTDGDVSPPPSKRKVPPSATSKAVANFFTPVSARKQEPELVTFKILHESVWTARCNAPATATATASGDLIKIAAFDFDDTIVTTASGNRFSKDAQDWKWWHPVVSERLKALEQDGYKVVFLSNQGAVKLKPDAKTLKSDTKSLNNLKGKVTSVLTRLALPITMYAATLQDIYRKPRSGLWHLLLNDLGVSVKGVDHNTSFFVGDAAGREGDKAKNIRKDHSCSDRDLAANVGIKFYTPEEFFLDEPTQSFVRSLEPKTFLDDTALVPVEQLSFTRKHDLDIVLFCGSPGAGKSTFYWSKLKPLGYERVNQDILKTRERCLAVASQHLQEGRSVAVDNTNADVEVRSAWVRLAKEFNAPIRLVHFTASAKLCEHNDAVRALGGDAMNPEGRKMLPKMAFTGFAGRYQEPKIEEGFEDRSDVHFKLEGTAEQKDIWTQYWVS